MSITYSNRISLLTKRGYKVQMTFDVNGVTSVILNPQGQIVPFSQAVEDCRQQVAAEEFRAKLSTMIHRLRDAANLPKIREVIGDPNWTPQPEDQLRVLTQQQILNDPLLNAAFGSRDAWLAFLGPNVGHPQA